MKRCLVVAILATALPALADTYSVAVSGTAAGASSTSQELKLYQARQVQNATACKQVGLPETCTKAQAVAIDASAKVFDDTAADRQAFVVYLAAQGYLALVAQRDKAARDTVKAGSDAVMGSGSTAEKNALCLAAGLASGCLP